MQDSAGAATAEETQARQFITSELHANFQSVDCVKRARASRPGTPAATSAQLC